MDSPHHALRGVAVWPCLRTVDRWLAPLDVQESQWHSSIAHMCFEMCYVMCFRRYELLDARGNCDCADRCPRARGWVAVQARWATGIMPWNFSNVQGAPEYDVSLSPYVNF